MINKIAMYKTKTVSSLCLADGLVVDHTVIKEEIAALVKDTDVELSDYIKMDSYGLYFEVPKSIAYAVALKHCRVSQLQVGAVIVPIMEAGVMTFVDLDEDRTELDCPICD